jgi:hypothetical protein
MATQADVLYRAAQARRIASVVRAFLESLT